MYSASEPTKNISVCDAAPPPSYHPERDALLVEAEINGLWQDQLEKDDRTSPEEYPDMALITFEEFRDAVLYVARLRATQAKASTHE